MLILFFFFLEKDEFFCIYVWFLSLSHNHNFWSQGGSYFVSTIPILPLRYKPVPRGKDTFWYISVQLRLTSYLQCIYHDYSEEINLPISFHKYFKLGFLYVDEMSPFYGWNQRFALTHKLSQQMFHLLLNFILAGERRA